MLQPLYDASLAEVPGGSSKEGGIEVGEAAAAAMLTDRQNDGRFGSFTFAEGTDPGEWRLAPPAGPAGVVARDPTPWVGFVRPFLVPNVDKLRTDARTRSTAPRTGRLQRCQGVGSLTAPSAPRSAAAPSSVRTRDRDLTVCTLSLPAPARAEHRASAPFA